MAKPGALLLVVLCVLGPRLGAAVPRHHSHGVHAVQQHHERDLEEEGDDSAFNNKGDHSLLGAVAGSFAGAVGGAMATKDMDTGAPLTGASAALGAGLGYMLTKQSTGSGATNNNDEGSHDGSEGNGDDEGEGAGENGNEDQSKHDTVSELAREDGRVYGTCLTDFKRLTAVGNCQRLDSKGVSPVAFYSKAVQRETEVIVKAFKPQRARDAMLRTGKDGSEVNSIQHHINQRAKAVTAFECQRDVADSECGRQGKATSQSLATLGSQPDCVRNVVQDKTFGAELGMPTRFTQLLRAFLKADVDPEVFVGGHPAVGAAFVVCTQQSEHSGNARAGLAPEVYDVDGVAAALEGKSGSEVLADRADLEEESQATISFMVDDSDDSLWFVTRNEHKILVTSQNCEGVPLWSARKGVATLTKGPNGVVQSFGVGLEFIFHHVDVENAYSVVNQGDGRTHQEQALLDNADRVAESVAELLLSAEMPTQTMPSRRALLRSMLPDVIVLGLQEGYVGEDKSGITPSSLRHITDVDKIIMTERLLLTVGLSHLGYFDALQLSDYESNMHFEGRTKLNVGQRMFVFARKTSLEDQVSVTIDKFLMSTGVSAMAKRVFGAQTKGGIFAKISITNEMEETFHFGVCTNHMEVGESARASHFDTAVAKLTGLLDEHEEYSTMILFGDFNYRLDFSKLPEDKGYVAVSKNPYGRNSITKVFWDDWWLSHVCDADDGHRARSMSNLLRYDNLDVDRTDLSGNTALKVINDLTFQFPPPVRVTASNDNGRPLLPSYKRKYAGPKKGGLDVEMLMGGDYLCSLPESVQTLTMHPWHDADLFLDAYATFNDDFDDPVTKDSVDWKTKYTKPQLGFLDRVAFYEHTTGPMLSTVRTDYLRDLASCMVGDHVGLTFMARVLTYNADRVDSLESELESDSESG